MPPRRRFTRCRARRYGAVFLEYRFQSPEGFHGHIVADMLVLVESDHTFTHFYFHRKDLIFEMARGTCRGRVFMALHGKRVLLVAGNLPFGGEIFRGYAHMAVAERIVQRAKEHVDEFGIAHLLAQRSEGSE